MGGGGRLAIGLWVLLATVVVVPAAQATEVGPAGEEIEATSVGPVSFLPSNGNGESSVVCETATITWTVVAAGENLNNVNQLEVGALSNATGGVLMEEAAPPAFQGCARFVGEEEVKEEVLVLTPGNWTLSVSSLNALVGFAAIGIPGAAGKIAFNGMTSCPLAPTTLFGTIFNAPNLLVVDGQFESPEGCVGFESPWQFEGMFEFNNGFAVFP